MHLSAWKVSCRKFALKLSEKGFEQRSERGFGQPTEAKTGRIVLLRCCERPRFTHLRDFSDGFLIYLQLPSATSSPALPVVSEWYQKAGGYRVFLALNRRDYAGSRIRTSQEGLPTGQLSE